MFCIVVAVSSLLFTPYVSILRAKVVYFSNIPPKSAECDIFFTFYLHKCKKSSTFAAKLMYSAEWRL